MEEPASLFHGMLFVKAVAAGFVVAVPIGAIGALCLRRSLQGRWAISLITGLGAAAADTVLAAAAMFGLSLIDRYLVANDMIVRLIGGLFLLGIGGRMILRRSVGVQVGSTPTVEKLRHLRDASGAFSAGFALTLINPATFLAFLGVLAGLGLASARPHGTLANAMIVVGVFLGSMLWWSTLTGLSAAMRNKIPPRTIGILNAILGLLVAGLGLASLLSLFGVNL